MAPGLDDFDVLLEVVLSLVRVEIGKPVGTFAVLIQIVFKIYIRDIRFHLEFDQ